MKRKITVLALCAMLFALCLPADAQQAAKIRRIGYLSVGVCFYSTRPASRHSGSVCASLDTLRGKNIVIEYRSAEGKLDRLPALAAELVRLKVDIIVTGGPQATRAAKEATVYDSHRHDAGSAILLASGFIASLARPGGNITGLSNLNRELSGKRLELLKEVVPKLSRVAVFGTSTIPGNAESLKEVETRRKGARTCSFNT